MFITTVLAASLIVLGASVPSITAAVSKTWKQAINWVINIKNIDGVKRGNVN